jgi:NAD(P)-dependent dehydrogenase (short-subunit alcohol dehydrogenase family)
VKRALVLGTGAIGSAVVRGLAARGVESKAVSRSTGVDLANADQVRALFRDPYDILVHCAAIHPPADASIDEFDAAVALSGRATYVAIRAFAEARAGQPGHVILVGALERAQSLPLTPAFAASQGMLGPLAMAFAKELGPKGILVNLVTGGLTGSGASARLSAEQKATYEKLSALHRLATPDEIAAPVVFLALDNAYMTGKTLAANGGI